MPPAAEEGQEAAIALSAANHDVHNLRLRVPPGWSLEPPVFANARTLVDVAPGEARSPSAHVQVYVEPRLDHDDALAQIRDFVAAIPAEGRSFTRIDGWAAAELVREELQPQPSQGQPMADPRVLRVEVYVAVADTLVVVSGALPPGAPRGLVDRTLAIAHSLRFERPGDPQQAAREIEALGTTPEPATEALAPEIGSADSAVIAMAETDGAAPTGSNERIDAAGRGELELATSPDGLDVVVALQARRFVGSNDGGASFPNAGTIGAGNGDPSIARGQSGDFYIAWIDSNCGTNYLTYDVTTRPPQPFGYDCTGIARSTDDGVSFQTNTVNPAVECIGRAPQGQPDPPGACFPDQEHIAADPVNAGGGGGDQVYSTWRNFNAANQDAGLVCSQDSGVNWTAPITLGGGSFFPRITVGQDGFVYVAAYSGGNYRLWKFSSCANGLALQAGFPVNVAGRTPYDCPFAGHDRCDQNPSSQTAVVDGTDPNHVYYAFAQDAGTPGSDSVVVVLDSLDGGANWRPPVLANPAVNARRIMPWLCSTGGDAVLTWYEQRTATDATDHYGAVVGLDGGGSLTPKGSFRISEVSDNWCDSGWPCGTRFAGGDTNLVNAAEACPNQPQLAGRCADGVANTADSNAPCDFSDEAAVPGTYCPQPGPSGNNELCLPANGCPKYGDYNGNACTGGKLFAAWPSASSPPGVPGPNTATNTGVLFDVVNLDAVLVPVITAPDSVRFGEVCTGSTGFQTMQICNTGSANLQVDEISSNDPEFAVTQPSSGWPVTISPDFCFPFAVTYTPTGAGDDTATLSVPSNDPSRPVITVEATATGDQQRLVTAINGNFGDVCLGGSATRELTLLNDSSCSLEVQGLSVQDDAEGEFSLATVMSTPFTLRAGESVHLDVEFSPVGGFGAASANVRIESDDPASPKLVPVNGNSPPPDIQAIIADDGDFGAVCKGDQAVRDLVLFNQGQCNLTISSIDLLPDPDSFELPANLGFPLVLSHDAEFTVPIVFAPQVCSDDPEQRTLRITSDDPDESVVDIGLNASSPCPNLVIDPPDGDGVFAFPPTVVDTTGSLGCFSDRPVTLRNNGGCPLTIDDVTASGADYTVTAPTQFPVLLPAGEETLTVNVRFTPQSDADPLAPSEVTGTLTVVSDDPDASQDAELCGESVAQSGVRILVTDISTGLPLPVPEVDTITLQSKGKNRPQPVNLRFTDQPVSSTTVCGNTITYHVDQETLPSADTTGANPLSSYVAKAREGNLQTTESFTLGQCELRDFQLQLQASDAPACLLLPKGAACDNDGQCCSGNCKGPEGGKSCK